MRVLYLANAGQIGGGNRVLLQLFQSIRPLGVTPVVVCPTDGPMVRESTKLGLECEVVDYRQPAWQKPLRSWAGFRAWRRVVERLRVDLIHANGLPGARSIVLAAKVGGVPLVCHVHFPPGTEGASWTFRHLPKPDAFLFCSDALREEAGPDLRRCYPGTAQHVVRNGIVVEDFVFPQVASPEPVATRYVVGIVANLIPIKGHLDFLEMAGVLTRMGVDAEYWIIGGAIHGGDYEQRLRTRVDELRLAARVKFFGHRSDVPALLQQIDVVVCSSHVEPFGMCVLEAMASGKAVVATRVGGIPEVIEEGVTGLLVAPRAPAELADGVRCLLSDAATRQRMGQAGRVRAGRDFSQKVHAEKTFAIYSRLLTSS